MRKLRRLPWRIPKTHHGQQPAVASAKAQPHVDHEAERAREREREREMQPVAFAGGRYVYGTCAAPSRETSRGTEIRRKARHRVMPLPVSALT
jgi:hypothetical protein